VKFLSSIVRHSLQLSKKPNTLGFPANPASAVTSQINQQSNNQHLNQADSHIPAPAKITAINNEKTAAIKQKDKKLTDNSNGFENDKEEQPSTVDTFADKAKIETNKNSKTIIHEASETPTHLQDVEQFQNKSIINKNKIKNKIEDKIEIHKNTVSKNSKSRKQEILQKQTNSIQPKEASQARREPKQKAITTQKQQKQQEQNNKHSYTDSVSLKNTQQDTTETEKQVHNNYYISRQKPPKPPLLKTAKQTKTIQQTPQVRIGQINVLIEDQAKTAPKPKAMTHTQTSSPFGYRGL